VVQVNSMPDALVFAAAVPRLLGARVLLDLHECMPEFFSTKFGTSLRHPGVRLMAAIEQLAIRYADHVITCTDQMKERFVERGAPPAKIDVILNAADETIFDPEAHPPTPREDGRFTLICHGSVEERYGHDTLIRAVGALRDRIPELRLQVFGDGSYLDDAEALVAELGLEDRVWFAREYVPMPQLLDALARADAGVVAMKRDAFRDLTQCNKMFDLIAMRRPAIISRTQSVEAYFDEDSFAWFTADDPDDLARAIARVYEEPELGDRLAEHAAEVNEPYRWPRQREIYLRAAEGLLRR
jgi:glycosyltransferase involved in cell wall biosynthesis